MTGWSHIPNGMCGLKLRDIPAVIVPLESHPEWDVWVEMSYLLACVSERLGSHPAWDVWVEIAIIAEHTSGYLVTSRMGCVG